MNDLVTRKQMLIAQADQHRRRLRVEHANLGERWNVAGSFFEHNRWWVLGGVVVGGVLLTRNWRGIAQWLPTLATLWQSFRK